MRKVYILLSKTGTLTSVLIHKTTRGAFTHTSLALTPEPNRFVSFGRRKLHNPLNGGVIKEDLHKLVFARYPDAPCALFSLEISDAGYEKIQAYIEFFLSNYKKARYNFLGMIPLRMGIRIPRKYRLVCSQFVAGALYASEEIKLPKDPYLMLPNDFLLIPNLRKIYEGTIRDCQFENS